MVQCHRDRKNVSVKETSLSISDLTGDEVWKITFTSRAKKKEHVPQLKKDVD